jgi:hypothetical protein
MQVDFEEIVNHPESFLPRQYRECAINPKDYWKVINTRGAYTNFGTSGSGYSNWYMYHTMDGRIVCIISSMKGDWSWQYEGVPPRPYVNEKLLSNL